MPSLYWTPCIIIFYASFRKNKILAYFYRIIWLCRFCTRHRKEFLSRRHAASTTCLYWGMTKCAHVVPRLPQVLCWRSIRCCHFPRGRAQTKNGNLWLSHIKRRFWKQMWNYYFFVHKDLSNPYRESRTKNWNLWLSHTKQRFCKNVKWRCLGSIRTCHIPLRRA